MDAEASIGSERRGAGGVSDVRLRGAENATAQERRWWALVG